MSMSEAYYVENYMSDEERKAYFEKIRLLKLAKIQKTEVGTITRAQGNGTSRRMIVEEFTCDKKGRPVRRIGRVATLGSPTKRRWVKPGERILN